MRRLLRRRFFLVEAVCAPIVRRQRHSLTRPVAYDLLSEEIRVLLDYVSSSFRLRANGFNTEIVGALCIR